MQIHHFLEQLINIPSISGDEYAITNFLHNYLSARGLDVVRFPVSNACDNLYVTSNKPPVILLSTHCDTVPPFIPARLEKDIVFGRGACDAKGIIAAMVYTMLALPQPVREKVGMLIVVGEETDSVGAKTAAGSGIQAKYVINGEPTSNRLVRAQKGTLIFKLTSTGKAVHSGYPDCGDSAITKLLRQLSTLQKLDWGIDPILGKASFNIGVIKGGCAANIIPDYAEATCCVRLVTDNHTTQRLLENHLHQSIECQIITNSNPVNFFMPDAKAGIVVPFGSDSAYLSKIGSILMAGPGDIHKAHTTDESIELAALYDAVNMYRELINQLL